jgi:hypothetical protein
MGRLRGKIRIDSAAGLHALLRCTTVGHDNIKTAMRFGPPDAVGVAADAKRAWKKAHVLWGALFKAYL